jgi:HEAT repeat protein
MTLLFSGRDHLPRGAMSNPIEHAQPARVQEKNAQIKGPSLAIDQEDILEETSLFDRGRSRRWRARREGVPMERSRRRFGPRLWVTLIVAVVVWGSRPFWSMIHDHWEAWRLAPRLRDPAPLTRIEAAIRLVDLGPVATRHVTSALRDSRPSVRQLACSIVLQTTPDDPRPALAALVAAAGDVDPSIRALAVEKLAAVARISSHRNDTGSQERAVRAIAAVLDDPAREVRSAAGNALSDLGSIAKSAAGDLVRALSGPDPWLRVHAAMALLKINRIEWKARVVPAITPLLADRSQGVSYAHAIDALKTAEGENALAARFIKNPREEAHAPAFVVQHLKQSAPETLPEFARALTVSLAHAKSEQDRVNAITALGEIGAPAASAVRALLMVADSPGDPLAPQALEALKKIDPTLGAAIKGVGK